MPFAKGQSGNPGGRRKEEQVAEVRDLAQKFTQEAIERLAHWMRTDNAKASVAACVSLLERGHGKALQTVQSETTVRYVARVPEKAPSTEIWQQQHEPRVH